MAGAVAIPLTIAYIAYAWNSQRTEQRTTTARVELALAVLREPNFANGSDDKLRAWAERVIQTPDTLGPTDMTKNEAGFGLAVDSAIREGTRDLQIELAKALLEGGGPSSRS